VRTANSGLSGRSSQRRRAGSLGRRARSLRRVPVRERSPGRASNCHDVPAAGRLPQRLPCLGEASAIAAGGDGCSIGKGDKERLVPLPQPVPDALGRLWRTHHNLRWLLPNHSGDAPLNNRVLTPSLRPRGTVLAASVSRDCAVAHVRRRRYSRHPARGNPTGSAAFLRDEADREPRRHPHRTDPARPRQHRHHCHLHSPDHAPRASLHSLLDRLMTGL
jgi:hypothetical protein